MLASFQPLMRWRSPVLEVGYPTDRDLHLGGRGLRLVPSFFCSGRPVSLLDPELPPVVVYPIAHDPWHPMAAGTGPRSLSVLLGATRAAVLEAVGDGCTTTELSRRARVSAASASQHASVLRGAGLISTSRTGGSVLHTLTPLGTALLRGDTGSGGKGGRSAEWQPAGSCHGPPRDHDVRTGPDAEPKNTVR
jgi:DNA-binding transcriptional ArsR family regulator